MKLLMALVAGSIAAVAAVTVSAPTTAQSTAAAPPAFAACRACHTVVKGGKNGIGPNLYRAFASAIRGDGKGWFPGVTDGLRTMRFIEAVIANAGSDRKWTSMDSGETE